MSGDVTVKVKNDSERLKGELKDLLTKNKPLHDLLFDVADYIKRELCKETIVTEIFREQEEQDKYYAKDAAYQVKKKVSPHQLYQAFDLRDWQFTKDEIKKIVDYINNKYNGTNEYKWTALDHNIGQGAHFHVQYMKKVK